MQAASPAFAQDVLSSFSCPAAQVRTIVDGIQPRIQKEFPQLLVRMRYAVVAYRDVGDDPPMSVMEFTKDPAQLENFVSPFLH